MKNRRNVTGVSPGFSPKGQVFRFGGFPRTGQAPTPFTPTATMAADLLLYRATTLAQSFPRNAEIEQAIEAFKIQASLLSQVAVGQIPGDQAKAVIDPLAASLEQYIPKIEKFSGNWLVKEAAQWFVRFMASDLKSIDAEYNMGVFNPQMSRGEHTARFTNAAQVLAIEAYKLQHFAFSPKIDGLTVWFIGAAANTLKLAANYPTLQIKGVMKLVESIERFAKQRDNFTAEDAILTQALKFGSSLEPQTVTICEELALVVDQFILTDGVQKSIQVSGVIDPADIVGAVALPSTQALIANVANTLVGPDSIPTSQVGISSGHRNNSHNASDHKGTRRQTALAGAGAGNSFNG